MSIGPYFVGDVPSQSATIRVERDNADADLSVFDNVEAVLLAPEGTSTALSASLVDDDVLVAWPEISPFTTPGLHRIRLTLTSLVGYRERTGDEAVVVQADDGWQTIESARAIWSEAPVDDGYLYQLLEVARIQCVEFAPDFVGRAPSNYAQAQLLQARALWASGNVSQGDQFGGEGLSVTVFPMDWTVKNLLRPTRAVRAFF